MNITIEFAYDKAKPDTKAAIEQMVNRTFTRIRSKIDKVHITLSGINGSQREENNACTVIIEGSNGSSVFVKDVQESLLKAAKNAIERAHYAFIRKRKRAQLNHHRRNTIAKVQNLTHHMNDDDNTYADHALKARKHT